MAKTPKQEEVISSLTPAQEALIPEYRERFKKIGLDTTPTDRTKAEAAMRKAYEYLHAASGECNANPEIVWADSPMRGAVLAAKAAKGSQTVTNKEVQEQASVASYGSFEAYWASVYVFIAEQLPVKKDELASILLAIVENCGICWTFEKLVIMTPKPIKISLNADEKLHCVDGPAIQWENGDGIYALNGETKSSLMEVVIAARNGGSDLQQVAND